MEDRIVKHESQQHAHGLAEPPVVTSEDLFRGARNVVIDHHGDRYVLRITRQNKLILNK